VRACISNFLHVRPQSGDSWSVRLFKWSYGLHTNTVVNRGASRWAFGHFLIFENGQ